MVLSLLRSEAAVSVVSAKLVVTAEPVGVLEHGVQVGGGLDRERVTLLDQNGRERNAVRIPGVHADRSDLASEVASICVQEVDGVTDFVALRIRTDDLDARAVEWAVRERIGGREVSGVDDERRQSGACGLHCSLLGEQVFRGRMNHIIFKILCQSFIFCS